MTYFSGNDNTVNTSACAFITQGDEYMLIANREVPVDRDDSIFMTKPSRANLPLELLDEIYEDDQLQFGAEYLMRRTARILRGTWYRSRVIGFDRAVHPSSKTVSWRAIFHIEIHPDAERPNFQSVTDFGEGHPRVDVETVIWDNIRNPSVHRLDRLELPFMQQSRDYVEYFHQMAPNLTTWPWMALELPDYLEKEVNYAHTDRSGRFSRYQY